MVAKEERIATGRFIGIFIFILIITCCAPKAKEIRPGPEVEAPPPPKPAKIALVLGAGASKGFAHVGVIKILESNKIPIHMIVGTSVGSVVGSFYASGYDAFQLQKLSFAIEKGEVVDLVLPENGFIKGEKLEEFVNKTVRNTPMEKLKIPFYAVTQMNADFSDSSRKAEGARSAVGIYRLLRSRRVRQMNSPRGLVDNGTISGLRNGLTLGRCGSWERCSYRMWSDD